MGGWVTDKRFVIGSAREAYVTVPHLGLAC